MECDKFHLCILIDTHSYFDIQQQRDSTFQKRTKTIYVFVYEKIILKNILILL